MDVGSELILCLSCRLPWNNVEHWRKHAPVSIVYLNVALQKLIRVWPSAAHGPLCEGHELHLRGLERITVIARGWQCLGAVDQKVGDVCDGLPKATAVHEPSVAIRRGIDLEQVESKCAWLHQHKGLSVNTKMAAPRKSVENDQEVHRKSTVHRKSLERP